MRAAAVAALAAPATAGVVNLTLYRVTPRNYTGLDNLNTGDAAGDAYFGLYALNTPLLCKPGKGAFGITCKSKGITHIPGFNVYSEYIVEADDRFGPYAECNPDPENGEKYACAHWDQQRNNVKECWWNSTANPEWATRFAGACSRDECDCAALFDKAVGAQLTNHSHGGGDKPAAGLPAQCMPPKGFFPQGHVSYTNGTVLREMDADEGACCAACAAETGCSATTWYNGTSRCLLLSVVWDPASGHIATAPEPGAFSTFYSPQSPDHMLVNAAVSHMQVAFQPAHWYSTQAVGHCRPGEVVGRDCWWRIVEEKRNVNSSCVNDKMLDSISAKNPGCFDACPQPANRESDCWLRCLFATISGNGTAPGISREDAVAPFQEAFADPKDGGCPSVPPCPEPCLPECWAVQPGQACVDPR